MITNKALNGRTHSGQPETRWDIAVDVGQKALDWYGELGAQAHQGHIANRNEAILSWLEQLNTHARQHGLGGVRILCEPTGGYERRLLRAARQLGGATALVNGEAVHQMQVVENNDTGKSDIKDPRTILLLAKWNKTLTDRPLQGEWLLLRELNARYDRLERDSTRCKNRIHKLLLSLFPELSFKNDWLFEGRAAQATIALYGLNAAAILADGLERCTAKLRNHHVGPKTIQRLFADAQRCALIDSDPDWLALLAEDLRALFAELTVLRTRRTNTRQQMIALVERLRARGATRLQAHPDLISPFMLARVLAETGPLRDFAHVRQLWRYGGLNLRPRQSGTMQGQLRQAKRGRARLRHVLAQAVLKRVVHGQLYGQYYHAKRDTGMCGGKAMTAVARKFLKLLHGLERSPQPFDPKRVFRSAA
ncbi:MAG: transposase [Nibricoccus sp.]